jgi:outer membrane protein
LTHPVFSGRSAGLENTWKESLMRGFARFGLLVVLVATALLAGEVSAAAQTKIGVVDLQLAVASTKAGKSAKEKLEKLTAQKQKELDTKVEKVQKMEEEMQKQMPLMSDAGKKDMLEKYRKEMMELQKLYMDNQTTLAKKKAELLEPILKKMGEVIQDLALSEGFTLILDRSEGTVLYFQPSLDVTPEVIKRYNQAK